VDVKIALAREMGSLSQSCEKAFAIDVRHAPTETVVCCNVSSEVMGANDKSSTSHDHASEDEWHSHFQ